jgi:hypothetical protein
MDSLFPTKVESPKDYYDKRIRPGYGSMEEYLLPKNLD